MARSEACAATGCAEPAVTRCANCGLPFCARHLVADFANLPGGQRPYCAACDAARRALYQRVRGQGLRAIATSAVGALGGALVGSGVGLLLSTDSFAHTVTTDLGFLVGLAVALYLTFRPILRE